MQTENDVKMTPSQTKALVESIFDKADDALTGSVTRAQIREAIRESEEDAAAL